MKSKVLFAIVGLIASSAVLFSTGCTKSSGVKGKVLRLTVKDNIKTADPINAYDEVTLDVLPQTFEALYQFDYYADKSNAVIPSLAESMPIVSKDKLTYTIKLKKGVRFQDDECFKATNGKGRELKAQDFVYGWKRHADPKGESQGFWIWDGKIKGINDYQKKFSSGKSTTELLAEDVEGFHVVDDYTIEIKLTKPYPQLIYILTNTFTTPVAKEAVEFYGKDFAAHPVGTGPFMVKTWAPTSKVVLVRNPNFRDDFFPTPDRLSPKYKELAIYSGKKLPLVDGLEFHVLKEEQPRWLGFLNGELDLVRIPKDNFNSAVVNGNQPSPLLEKNGVSLSIENTINLWYVTMNLKDKVLGQNKYLRQAIASAIDQAQWLALFKNGRGFVQNELNPTEIVDRCGSKYRWTFDLERSKALLAKAGFPEGKGLPVIQFDTRTTEMADRQLAEFIQMNLAKVGIKLQVNSNTFPAFIDKMNHGRLQMSKGGFIADYPDAENLLQLVYGPNKSPGPNDSQFENAEFDALYEKIAAMESGSARRALICKAEQIVEEEAPLAYGIHENEFRAVHSWVKNFHTSELILNKYKFIDILEAERAAFKPVR